MSSTDRYRPPPPPPPPPPREGPHPPSLPTKPPLPPPPPTALDRASPHRQQQQRHVPPAAPSPPGGSSRTSPPRPYSRRSAPSPVAALPPSEQHQQQQQQQQQRRSSQTPQPPSQHIHRQQDGAQRRQSQWLFTRDEVLSSPSILDGLAPVEERLRRAKGVNFICQVGVLLELPQITLWVAAVFFHRYYMRQSMIEETGGIHHYNIAATSLFLANKTEENCRKTKELIFSVVKVAQKNSKLIIDEQNKEYWRWRDSIMSGEESMLEVLTFDLMVENPYTLLYDQLQKLQKLGAGLIHNKKIRIAAWAFCADASYTILPLLASARDVAIAAVFFASSTSGEKIDDIAGEPWWVFLGADEGHVIQAIDVMLEFYKENPLKKTYPGSPEFKLENTRRRGQVMLSQSLNDGGASSRDGTPLGTDRDGTQSPRNGAGGGGGGGGGGGDDDYEGGGRGAPTNGGVRNGRTQRERDSGGGDGYSQPDGPEAAADKAHPGGERNGHDGDGGDGANNDKFRRNRSESDAALRKGAVNLTINGGRGESPATKRKTPDIDAADSDGDGSRQRTKRARTAELSEVEAGAS